MLLIMALVLMVLTFFIWAGIPIFIMVNAVAEITSNVVIIHLCISLSGGFLFSLLFAPINLKVAINLADIKHRSVINSFIRIEIIWMLVCSLIFELVFIVVTQL